MSAKKLWQSRTRYQVEHMKHAFCAIGFALGNFLTAAAQDRVVTAVPPPLLPIADFAKTFAISEVAISPDGRTLAYQAGLDKEWMLFLRDWDTGKTRSIGPGAGPSDPVWINGERVLYGNGASVDRDGKNSTPNGPAPRNVIFHRFSGDQHEDVLAIGSDRPVMGRYQPIFVISHFHVAQHHTRQGSLTRVIENPGGVTGWLVDGSGIVKIGVEDDGVRRRVLHRTAANEPWRVPTGLDFAQDKVRAHWLNGDGKTLYVTLPSETGRWALHSYDLEKQQVGELLLSHDLFDIVPRPVLGPATQELLGVHWVGEKPRTFWFHSGLAEIQRALDQALPGMVNTITSLSDDLQRMVVRSASARDPGTFYQFDGAKKALKPLFPVRPWVKPAQSAEVFPASFKSRDALTINGYLTIPAGREAKLLPLVVRANPDAWRRATWGYDADVQFLANRGYAVLEINARGSQGYGQDFYEKGKRRIGREVQQDITDGVRWAIERGIADPARVAIMGEHFGGYSALCGIVQNPGLYRCAISIDGVVDWPAQLAYLEKIDAAQFPHHKDRFGDSQTAATELAEISPINHVADIGAPLLLIHGHSNFVSREAARAFVSALAKAKKPHEVLDKFDEIDGVHMPKPRAEMLAKIEKFLAQNMGPFGAGK